MKRIISYNYPNTGAGDFFREDVGVIFEVQLQKLGDVIKPEIFLRTDYFDSKLGNIDLIVEYDDSASGMLFAMRGLKIMGRDPDGRLRIDKLGSTIASFEIDMSRFPRDRGNLSFMLIADSQFSINGKHEHLYEEFHDIDFLIPEGGILAQFECRVTFGGEQFEIVYEKSDTDVFDWDIGGDRVKLFVPQDLWGRFINARTEERMVQVSASVIHALIVAMIFECWVRREDMDGELPAWMAKLNDHIQNYEPDFLNVGDDSEALNLSNQIAQRLSPAQRSLFLWNEVDVENN